MVKYDVTYDVTYIQKHYNQPLMLAWSIYDCLEEVGVKRSRATHMSKQI